MATVDLVDERTIRVHVTLEDAIAMVEEAARHMEEYAGDIVTIFERMPEFAYVHFCFYAYDSAKLFEQRLGVDPKQYTSFSLDAPDSFFYALYGGMAALAGEARRCIDRENPIRSRKHQVTSNDKEERP